MQCEVLGVEAAPCPRDLCSCNPGLPRQEKELHALPEDNTRTCSVGLCIAAHGAPFQSSQEHRSHHQHGGPPAPPPIKIRTSAVLPQSHMLAADQAPARDPTPARRQRPKTHTTQPRSPPLTDNRMQKTWPSQYDSAATMAPDTQPTVHPCPRRLRQQATATCSLYCTQTANSRLTRRRNPHIGSSLFNRAGSATTRGWTSTRFLVPRPL